MTETRLLNLQDSAQIIFTHIWLTGYEKMQNAMKSNLFWIRIYVRILQGFLENYQTKYYYVRTISWWICSRMKIQMLIQKRTASILKKKT